MKISAALTICLVFAAPTIAEAACKTTSLAGQWQIVAGDLSGADQCLMIIGPTGAVSGSCTSTSLSGSLTQTSACLITGKINGAAFRGRTEMLETTSALKPALITGSLALSSPVMLHGYRK